ncbi:MAG TPA: winged helix-turn-helix domain-containing protein [Candidatus Bathyarchaeia archaeon]|nr:winged helix-turn-helix domain-containing protein [Candidatus Bathyarchaeia archaeon]
MVQTEIGESIGHRGRFDIMANILSGSVDGAKKTQLMYKCNMSFKQLEAYLDLLTEKKLIHKRTYNGSKDPIVYEITEKGHSFLRFYDNLKALLTV